MYNQEIKEQYLQHLEESNPNYYHRAKRIFELCKRQESSRKKDAAAFSKREIFLMYKAFDYMSTTLQTANSILKGYAQFYKEKIDSGILNHYGEITMEELRKCTGDKEKPRISYNQLQSVLAELENPVDKFLLYGIFSGINGKCNCEILYVTKGDIRVAEKKIALPGLDEENRVVPRKREIAVDEQLCRYALNAADTYTYVFYTEKAQRIQLMTDRIYKPRLSEDKSEDIFTDRHRLYDKVKRLTLYLGLEHLNIKNIYWSGVAYQVKLLSAKNNLENPMDAVLLPEFCEIRRQYNLEASDNNLRKALRGYL